MAEEEKPDEILDQIIQDNRRDLALVKKYNTWAGVSYKFRVSFAVEDEVLKRYFVTQDEAMDWLNKIDRQTDRKRRKKYAFQVTVRKPQNRFESRANLYVPGTLKGVNASDGNWRVVLALRNDKDHTVTVSSGDIYRRMSENDAKRLADLDTQAWEINKQQKEVTEKYRLQMPHSGFGRIKVDEAIEIDEKMVLLFETDEDD